MNCGQLCKHGNSNCPHQICNECLQEEYGMNDEKKPREFYVEKKLKSGVNRAFDPDNVEGGYDLFWHVIEYSAFDQLRKENGELMESNENLRNRYLELRACLSPADMKFVDREALGKMKG